MPSIVLFGKLFCINFSLGKFLRDFQGFRPARTQLLFSDLGRSQPPKRFCRRLKGLRAGVDRGSEGLLEGSLSPVRRKIRG